jgi:quinoprotein glucose dehydrogenase
MFLRFLFLTFFYSFSVFSLTLEKFDVKLNYPWGMTWLDSTNLLITQKKSKEIVLVDTKNNVSTIIEHQIPVEVREQGGLLDIISDGNTVWITCSIKKGPLLTTAIFKSRFENNSLVGTKLIFEALPYIDTSRHFGSRLAIQGEYLFASIGERGKGMIAQDPTNAIGSVIRIHKNGSAPNDNPYIDNPDWLPQVFQIGVRNPQGMDLDPLTDTVYISNHGPKGGDFIGPVLKGTNYGWKRVAWGGKNYSGTKVGEGNAWEPGLLKPDHIWVTSIGVGGIKFYQGSLFPEWNNSLLVGSLKFQYLSILHRLEEGFGEEEIIFKNKIGRIRDIEINQEGEIFLIADEYQTNLFKLTP